MPGEPRIDLSRILYVVKGKEARGYQEAKREAAQYGQANLRSPKAFFNAKAQKMTPEGGHSHCDSFMRWKKAAVLTAFSHWFAGMQGTSFHDVNALAGGREI
jgi:hypothetical protein